jgi:hypothetical protein
MKLVTIIPSVQGSSTYQWGPFSVAQVYGGLMPTRWGIFVTHNTGVSTALSNTSSALSYIPVKYESN